MRQKKKNQKPGKDKTIPLKKTQTNSSEKVLFSPFQLPFSSRGRSKSHLPQPSPKGGVPAHCAPMLSTKQFTSHPGVQARVKSLKIPPAMDSAPMHTYLNLSLLYGSLILCNAHPMDQFSTLAVPTPDRAQKK